MNRTPILVIFFSFLFTLHTANSLEEKAKDSLVTFLRTLTNNNSQLDAIWNLTSDPCLDHWKGIVCDSQAVKKINLTRFNLFGSFDATPLCNDSPLASSLFTLILDGNNIGGEISADIANCKRLTRLQVSKNRFSENISGSLSMLNNLKRLDVSHNKFSGSLPNLSRISGLTVFLAQFNHLTGNIPALDFSNLDQFNVSYNDFSGPAPDTNGRFPGCYIGNSKLCGDQLPNKCPPSNSTSESKKSKSKVPIKKIVMYSGYVVVGIVLIIFIIYKLLKRKKTEQKTDAVNKVASIDDTTDKPRATSSDQYKTGENRLEVSMVSGDQSAMVSSALVVLTSPEVNGLKFEDLLRAPAELLGRGMYGSLYKIMLENGMVLVVKRIKDWSISTTEFKHRMQRLDQAKHPNVLPALAFYSSQQEKLLVYEYQQNGSLLRLLQGTQMGQAFEWSCRLGIAAGIAEALAFMHQELGDDGIAHGNLKSSNILLNKNMEPCISEYGLIVMDNNQASSSSSIISNSFKGTGVGSSSDFRADIYRLGVILLELLTGRLVQSDGNDLTKWVLSVVQEEWTAEVFDKSLISEGASEERMVNLLQVAIKCVHSSPEARPTIKQVTVMINTLKEEEDKSLISEA